ncbi:hypothetical protein AVEN_12900-1 [Araneus ventricosus]|uniref:Uncharacterized protein n=1 Tax=Araneus ventricosus TaxID=182803 RepID=A0A4Y2HKJ3_ARAVE|nr:hypothetical protein AVEN_12900-1 [Araneus ventricosus]
MITVIQDMENYWQWKLTNNVKQFLLKPNVVPHIFDCRIKRPVLVERSAAKKRKNMHLVQEAMSSYNSAQYPALLMLHQSFLPPLLKFVLSRKKMVILRFITAFR